ncbi:MAG TPA: hypothetical protein VLZ89_13445 [Anaerolineales bacterium]|nr:hypothetical protein [Anaerolineales bacterium]
MPRSNLISPLAVILLLSGLSCILPSTLITDSNAISTSAAQTVVAQWTGQLPSATLAPAASSPTPFPTATLAPTQTPSPTPSLTETHPPIIIPTLTASTLSVSVSVPTNCRTGPGLTYEVVGYLLVGETAQAYGRDAASLHWYIRNPDDPNSFCWISGKYANLSGNLSGIPVYTPEPTPALTPTPMPTPTPYSNLAANYSGLDSCQNWWTEFNLTNNGSITYRSVEITVLDTVKKITVTKTTDGFINNNGCLVSTSRSALGPGSSAVISAQPFGYDPTGHKLRATITLCAKTGLKGNCTTLSTVFTP